MHLKFEGALGYLLPDISPLVKWKDEERRGANNGTTDKHYRKKKKKKEDISLEGNFISSFQTFLTITVSSQ